MNITGSNNHYSLISLNINGLNSPIKGHRLTNWIRNEDPAFCCLQETHLRDKDRHYLRVKGWKTTFQANGQKKQAGVAILISNKINFQLKVIKKGAGEMAQRLRALTALPEVLSSIPSNHMVAHNHL